MRAFPAIFQPGIASSETVRREKTAREGRENGPQIRAVSPFRGRVLKGCEKKVKKMLKTVAQKEFGAYTPLWRRWL
jgi:hypothetical protein